MFNWETTKAAYDLRMAVAWLNPGKEDAYYTRIELKKRAKDLTVGVYRQNTAPIQGARSADPLQKLLDRKKEEKKKGILTWAAGEIDSHPYRTFKEYSHQASSNKETGRSQLGKAEKTINRWEREGAAPETKGRGDPEE